MHSDPCCPRNCIQVTPSTFDVFTSTLIKKVVLSLSPVHDLTEHCAICRHLPTRSTCNYAVLRPSSAELRDGIPWSIWVPLKVVKPLGGHYVILALWSVCCDSSHKICRWWKYWYLLKHLSLLLDNYPEHNSGLEHRVQEMMLWNN